MGEERANPEILEALVPAVRRASAEGRLVNLGDAAGECFPDLTREEAVLQLTELLPQTGELAVIGEGEKACLYAREVMTDAYARMAYSSRESDVKAVIAGVVREDSRVYPRPTALKLFSFAPWEMSPETVQAALAEMAADPEYADIRQTAASDGQVYLYSTRHMVTELAESLAEWDAVEQFNNP